MVIENFTERGYADRPHHLNCVREPCHNKIVSALPYQFQKGLANFRLSSRSKGNG
jgi:hypothetical protein